MKVLVLLACAAVATADLLPAAVEEQADVWSLFDNNADISAQLSSLEGRISSLESLGDAVGSAISVSQSSTSRLDDLVAEVAALKQKLAIDAAELSSGLANTVTKKDLSNFRDHAAKTANTLVSGAVSSVQASRLSAVERAAHVTKSVDDSHRSLDDALAQIDDVVNEGVEAMQKASAFSGSAEHIKQVTGIDYKNTKSYLVWEKTSQSSFSQVRGRKFYKIKFNLNKPGYFTSGSDEMFMACRALSMALLEKDGVERDLVPPCNHPGHSRVVGGQGQCFHVERSYFSHCGSSGYWSWTQACGGIPERDLRGIVGYESNEHNYDRHLCHRSVNNHFWCNPYNTDNNYQYTLCTSSNVNFKK